LVGKAVQRLKWSSGGRLDVGTTEADLIQEGCIALLRAAERFDVEVGVRFSTYATFWVKAAIQTGLQQQSRLVRLPARVQQTYGKIRRATDALVSQSGASRDEVTDADVSAELLASGIQLSPQRIRQVVEHVRARPVSLDVTLSSSTSSQTTVLDLVVDETSCIQADIVKRLLQADLSALMSKHLRADEQRVLNLRFGLVDGKARTVREVGEECGISYAAAKHVLWTALSKMRRPHVAKALREMQDGLEGDTV